jgi:hypothetical protein
MVAKGEIEKQRRRSVSKSTRSVNAAPKSRTNIEQTPSGVWVWTGPIKPIDTGVLIDELRDERTDAITCMPE